MIRNVTRLFITTTVLFNGYMSYFIENRYKNHNKYAIETAERLAHEFSGLHFDKIDAKLTNRFKSKFICYCFCGLVKDCKIYHSYINHYSLKIEDFTEKKKVAINNKNHHFFAFNKSTTEKSYRVIQFIPNHMDDNEDYNHRIIHV